MRFLLVIYDNGSFNHFFPVGAAYIASVLRQSGHEIKVYNQDVHHYPDQHLTSYLDKNYFDAVGIGVIAGYYQYRKLLNLSKAINESSNRPPHFILGGHGPTPDPEFFLQKTGADIAVLGEGEETIIELMQAISNKEPLNDIQGIAYRDENKVSTNPQRSSIIDIDALPWPAYDLFPIEHYRLLRYPHASNSDFSLALLSARGCTFTCNFCYRMDKGYRKRNPENIVEEIKYLQKDFGITYIDFSDELLMSSKSRVIELCEVFINSKLKFKWFCNGRLNYATTEIVQLMKEAGCVFINYGIEAIDDQVLKNMNKSLSTKQIIKGIEETLKAGISPGINVIWGNIGDNKDTLRKGVEFLLKYDDGAQLRTIRPVTPYPGSPLFGYAIENSMLKDTEDFYENKHINSDLLSVNFTDLSDDEFHECLMEANTMLIDNYYKKKCNEIKIATKNLYLNNDSSFRGYRHA